MSELWDGIINFKNAKCFKRYKSVAWHATKWWDWCISDDEKKK